MKVLVMIKGDGADEDKVAPTDEMFAEMNVYNEQLVNAGIMLAGEGLKPSSKRREGRLGHQRRGLGGRRPVRGVEGDHRRLLDLAGELAGRGRRVGQALPVDPELRSVLEIRPFFEMEDFAQVVSPEILAKEQALVDRVKEQHG